MRIEETPLQGCVILHDTVYEDDRGFFFESFNARRFAETTGHQTIFVQDNQSRSSKGTLRGIHFQLGEHAQAKLVRVLRGEVLDVAVDLRTSSPTFGHHFSVKLSEHSRTQLFIPRGFGHAFLVLSDTADFFYKCDNYYNKSAEAGIIYNDPELSINWGLDEQQLLISSKDQVLPTLQTIKNLL